MYKVTSVTKASFDCTIIIGNVEQCKKAVGGTTSLLSLINMLTRHFCCFIACDHELKNLLYLLSISIVPLHPPGLIFVADQHNNAIRRVTLTGNVSTLAGNGSIGFLDGEGQSTRFNLPLGIAVSGDQTVYVSDTNNNAIRQQ
jgi:hypothetical protein